MPQIAVAAHAGRSAAGSRKGSKDKRPGSKERTDSKGITRIDSKELGGGSRMRNSSKELAFVHEMAKTLKKSNSLTQLEDHLAGDNLAELADKYSREIFHQVESLPAVVLMNNGKFDDLRVSDMQELFAVLDQDKSGTLDFQEVELMLKEVLNPPCSDEQVEAIYALTDKRSDHHITADEFFRALVDGEVKEALVKMQHQNRTRKEFEQKLGLDVVVERDCLLDSLKHAVKRDDAFRTLPFSLAFITIFIFLVVAHMKIWNRQQLERGIESWVHGYGKRLLGPYLNTVSNVDGMFGWAKASGIPSLLGDCQATPGGDPFCQVGTRSVLIGDVQLKQRRKDGSEVFVWLLHSAEAQEYLRVNPGEYLAAATTASDHLHRSKWADEDTMDMRLSFSSYGPRSQLFAVTDVYARFDEYGYALPGASSTAVVPSSYPLDMLSKVVVCTFDALYALCLFIPMYLELKSMIRGMRLSGMSDGFRGYWDVWNIVDWVNILSGYCCILVWILCCQAMNAESLHSLLRQEDDKLVLNSGIMGLHESALEKLEEDLRSIASLMNYHRVLMAINVIAIMMKFIKAFQANPRLQLVTNTMAKAATDIVHFGVVFLSVFIGFAITGHILLGNDIVQFRSFSASIDTCFVVLMGEFEWYASASESEVPPGSGLPYFLMASWFWLYMIFVLMILLNMLLAIILDHYTELVMAIKLDVDVKALWTQTYDYFAHLKKTKDHIPLTDMCVLLEDDDTPCHQHHTVTENSLMQAFPEMQADEAVHLMEWLKAEAKKNSHEKDDECLARLKMLEKYVDSINQDLHVVKLNSAVCTSRLQGKASGHMPGQGQTSAGPQIFEPGQADQFVEQVDRLTSRIGAAIRDQTGRMGVITEELASQSVGVRRESRRLSLEAGVSVSRLHSVPGSKQPSRPQAQTLPAPKSGPKPLLPCWSPAEKVS